MQDDPPSKRVDKTTPPQTPQTPKLKNWQSQAQRTAASIKKLKSGVDALRPIVDQPFGKPLPRTEIPYRALHLLRGVKHGSLPPDAILHTLTAAIFEHAFIYASGSMVSLGAAWTAVISRFQELRPDVVQWLNRSDNKSAFIWQIAGHLDAFSRPALNLLGPVVACKSKTGPRKGQIVHYFHLPDGSFAEIPKNWEPDWPQFLVPGDYWRKHPITAYTVANVSFSWPCPRVDAILKTLLWQPPLPAKRKRKQ